jgi:hypothetical protein
VGRAEKRPRLATVRGWVLWQPSWAGTPETPPRRRAASVRRRSAGRRGRLAAVRVTVPRSRSRTANTSAPSGMPASRRTPAVRVSRPRASSGSAAAAKPRRGRPVLPGRNTVTSAPSCSAGTLAASATAIGSISRPLPSSARMSSWLRGAAGSAGSAHMPARSTRPAAPAVPAATAPRRSASAGARSPAPASNAPNPAQDAGTPVSPRRRRDGRCGSDGGGCVGGAGTGGGRRREVGDAAAGGPGQWGSGVGHARTCAAPFWDGTHREQSAQDSSVGLTRRED